MTNDKWNPEQYEKFKVQRSQPFYDLMNLLEPVGSPRVVDLGCGTGELTAELHSFLKTSETVGIDSSDSMLAKAQAFAGAGLSFRKQAIETFTDAQKFDVVFSNAALQWCGDHPALIARLKLALKPHGQLAVQMPMNHDYPTHLIAYELSHEEPWASLLGAENYEKPLSMLSVEQYASLLFKLGFREQKVSVKVYGHELESREGVIEWVRGSLLTYFESRLSPENYQAFVTEFTRRLFVILPDEQPFFYPFKRLLMWARA